MKAFRNSKYYTVTDCIEIMKKEILIVKNITREGPGLLEDLLNEFAIQYKVVDFSLGESFPSPVGYGAVVVLGGPDSANDENNKMHNEFARIRETIDAHIPYLGICLGLQTLVKAAGGKVVKNSVKEIGFRDPESNNFAVILTKEGKEDPLFKNLSSTLKVFHLHGETVEVTGDMKLLATGKFCHNQIIKVGQNAYGIQCHFELTPGMFEEWVNKDPDLLLLDKEKLHEDFNTIREEYTNTGKHLLRNFLHIAGF